MIPSKTLQIVSLRRFTLPLDRAPAPLRPCAPAPLRPCAPAPCALPPYPPIPTSYPSPPSSRRTPGPMVADRIMMGDITGTAATVGPGVRRDDGGGGLGLRVDGAWGELANWRTGELANWRTGELRQRPSPRSNSTFAPLPSPSTLALQTQRERRWIATDALSNLLHSQMRSLAWPDRGKAPVVGRRWSAAGRASPLDTHLAFAKCVWACLAPPSRLP